MTDDDISFSFYKTHPTKSACDTGDKRKFKALFLPRIQCKFLPQGCRAEDAVGVKLGSCA